MKPFGIRRQRHLGKAISAKVVCEWAEISTEDVRIVIDGSKTDNTLIIYFEANGVRYMLTDVLMEVMLGYVAENFSNEYLNFRVHDLPR